MSRILMVTKDIGSANVISPIAKLAREAGNEILLIVEGLAAKEMDNIGIPFYFRGTENFMTEPFSIDAHAVVKRLKSLDGGLNCVITGLSAPINLEQEFGLTANELKVPLVEIECFWGDSIKSKAIPQIIFTLDESVTPVLKNRHPKSEILVAGNPGVVHVENISPHPEIAELRKKYDKLICYAGGGENTSLEISFLLECLKQTKGNWCLIFKPHPKYAKLDDPKHRGKKYLEVWEGMLSILGDRLARNLYSMKADDVVCSTDMTIASFSTLLTTGAVAGKTAISLWLPSTKKELFEETGLLQVPIVTLGCAHEVSEPIDLASLSPPAEQNLKKIVPYDPEFVLGKIKELIG